jgi:hypothetical protein
MPSHIATEHVPHHHDKEWLTNAINSGKNSRDIGRELQVSYKLVEIKLAGFGIPFTSQKPDTSV